MGLITGDKQVVTVGSGKPGIVAAVVIAALFLVAVGVAGFGASQPIQASNETVRIESNAKVALIHAQTAQEVALTQARAQEALTLAKADAARVQADGAAQGLRDGLTILMTCAGVGLLAMALGAAYVMHTRATIIRHTFALAEPERVRLEPPVVRVLPAAQVRLAQPARRVKVGEEVR